MLRAKKITVLAIGAVTLVSVFLSLRACTHNFHAEECAPDKQTLFPAPNKPNEAVVKERICSGLLANSYDAFYVWVRNQYKATDPGTEVFVTTDFQPAITWRDNTHLIITLRAPSFIGTSLRQAKGVTVIYRLADGLLEKNYIKTIEEDAERTAQDIRSRALAAGRDPQSGLEGVKSAQKEQLESYRRFMEWAKRNAENATSTD